MPGQLSSSVKRLLLWADFVTAMMAFFLMMWLLGATTENQRKGLADYFSPSIPVHRTSAGGDGSMGGEGLGEGSQLSDGAARSAGSTSPLPEDQEGEGTQIQTSLDTVESALLGMGGESLIMEQALRHVVTRLTDEGLIVELFDLPDVPLFEAETAVPTPMLQALIGMIAEISGLVQNTVAIEAHTRSYAVVRVENPVWELSMTRAQQVRMMLTGAGLDQYRIARVTGHGDRDPAVRNAMALRNNRLEVILLRRNY
jgi:chemotaxis protein MotB